MQNIIFSVQTSGEPPTRKQRWLSYVAIFGLVSASTAAMMFCPCDTVGIHDHFAISLVTIAALFAIAAANLIYRSMSRDSGITGFLHAVIALAVAGVSVYVELFLAQEVAAWLASRP